MAILELQNMHRLAEVIRGTDVRGILAGHLHHSMSGMFAGIPVSVAAATCYTIDPSAPVGSLLGVDGAQSMNLVHVYDDQILHSTVPVVETRPVSGFPDSVLDRLAQLTHEQRIEAFFEQDVDVQPRRSRIERCSGPSTTPSSSAARRVRRPRRPASLSSTRRGCDTGSRVLFRRPRDVRCRPQRDERASGCSFDQDGRELRKLEVVAVAEQFHER